MNGDSRPVLSSIWIDGPLSAVTAVRFGGGGSFGGPYGYKERNNARSENARPPTLEGGVANTVPGNDSAFEDTICWALSTMNTSAPPKPRLTASSLYPGWMK